MSGYTEAEKQAAEWSKQRKKQEQAELLSNVRDRPVETSYRQSEKGSGEWGTGSREAGRRWEDKREPCNRDREYKVDFSRASSRDSRDRSCSRRHRSRSRERTKEPVEDKNVKNVDHFGREIIPGMSKHVKITGSHRSPSRSRSRSNSRSRDSRRQNRRDNTWRHDKFDREVSPDRDERRSQVPSDYRPPSPTWVSKAGGVAIMRKKSD